MNRPVTYGVAAGGGGGRPGGGGGCPPPPRAAGGPGARPRARPPSPPRVLAGADPPPHRREVSARRHDIPPQRAFASWQELAAAPRMADAAILATQAADHVGPAVTLADNGYHLMVEKPLAPTEEECVELVRAVTEAGVLFAVCHVLRYRPYTRLLNGLLDDGRIGDVMSVQHLEPVGHWHYAHSYVRGNWRRSDTASFMLLAKSGHDIDWLRHTGGRQIGRGSRFGSPHHFPPGPAPRAPPPARPAPRAAAAAPRAGWPVSVIPDDVSEAGVTAALRDGPY